MEWYRTWLWRSFALVVSSLPKLLGLGNGKAPAREDNINILQLKWVSGKMKEIVTF
jgi:hypothetical protein